MNGSSLAISSFASYYFPFTNLGDGFSLKISLEVIVCHRPFISKPLDCTSQNCCANNCLVYLVIDTLIYFDEQKIIYRGTARVTTASYTTEQKWTRFMRGLHFIYCTHERYEIMSYGAGYPFSWIKSSLKAPFLLIHIGSTGIRLLKLILGTSCQFSTFTCVLTASVTVFLQCLPNFSKCLFYETNTSFLTYKMYIEEDGAYSGSAKMNIII